MNNCIFQKFDQKLPGEYIWLKLWITKTSSILKSLEKLFYSFFAVESLLQALFYMFFFISGILFQIRSDLKYSEVIYIVNLVKNGSLEISENFLVKTVLVFCFNKKGTWFKKTTVSNTMIPQNCFHRAKSDLKKVIIGSVLRC